MTNSNNSNYKIEWRGGCPNFWQGRNGNSVVAICNHIMQGTQESTDGWFKNPTAQASSHFGVAKDGRIWKWVLCENSAWANGIVGNPDQGVQWIKELVVGKKINPNYLTISIEHEGNTGVTFPEAQYQATLWLHKQIMLNYPQIKANRQCIIGHYQIDSINRPNCPGTAFPWARLIADLQVSSPNPHPTPQPSPEFNPNPDGYLIGDGLEAFLKANGLQAGTNEQYFTADSAENGIREQRSFCWTSNVPGLVCISFCATDGSGVKNWTTKKYQEKG